MSENWAPVITSAGSFPFFSVSDQGRLRLEPHMGYVKSNGRKVPANDEPQIRAPYVKKTRKTGTGGERKPSVVVRLWTPERTLETALDQAVLRSHEPEFPQPQGAVIHHWNGDPYDCRLENLEWAIHLRKPRDEGKKNLGASDWVEEYRFLRSCGLNHDEIAHKMAMTVDSVDLRVRKYDCWVPAPSERHMLRSFERLASSGRGFTLTEVSLAEDRSASYIVRDALRRGQIRVERRMEVTRDYAQHLYVGC